MNEGYARLRDDTRTTASATIQIDALASENIYSSTATQHIDEPALNEPDAINNHQDSVMDDTTGQRIKYSNFSTIDWIHDLAKERVRQKRLRTHASRIPRHTSNNTRFHNLNAWWRTSWDASEGWICVTLIGLVAGVIAAFISVAAEWLTDIRQGYCANGAWYLNKSFCCWQVQMDHCHEWQEWSDVGILKFLIYVSMAAIFAGVSAYLVRQLAPYASGSGIPEVKTILGGFVIRKFLGIWTLVIKSIGLALSVASGLALGKEGPLVHVVCSCGNIFSRFFKQYATNEAKKREILSAAAAAGVSVAFGAPIGGVLFSLEEVSYYFPFMTLWRSFFCASIAAVSLQMMNPFRTHQLVMFQVAYQHRWHGFELIFFVLLGVFGGLYGALFIRLNIKLNAWRRRSFVNKYPVSEVLAVCIVSAFVSYMTVFSRMNMSELVANLFRECEENNFYGLCDHSQRSSVIPSLLFVAVLKACMTVFTFGLRIPAGIFVPSLAVGACVGRVVGILAQMIHEANPTSPFFASCALTTVCITPGSYAIAAAAATLAGVTRMTVSLVVIVFELTGALSYVLPVMVSVMVAKMVGDYFGKEGIYDALIELNHYPYLDVRARYDSSKNLIAEDVMLPFEKLLVVAADGMTLQQVEDMIENTDVKGFPVLSNDSDRLFLGYVGRAEIRYAITQHRSKRETVPPYTACSFAPRSAFVSRPEADTTAALDRFPDLIEIGESPLLHVSTNNESPLPNSIDFRSWIDQTPICLSTDLPMNVVLEIFKKMGLRYVAVTKHGKLEGLITKKDLLSHLSTHELVK